MRFSRALRELSKTLRELSKVLRELSKTLRELSKTLRELSKTLRELSKTLRELSKTLGELSKTLGELSKELGEPPLGAGCILRRMYKKKSPDLHRFAKPASPASQQTACRSRFAFKRTLSVYCAEPGTPLSGFASRCKAGAFSYTCDAEYSLRRAGSEGRFSVFPATREREALSFAGLAGVCGRKIRTDTVNKKCYLQLLPISFKALFLPANCKVEFAILKTMGNHIRHQGIVEKVEKDQVFVRIKRQTACSDCHVQTACPASDKKDRIIAIDDHSGRYAASEPVIVSIQSSAGFFAVLTAFILPLALVVIAVTIVAGKSGSEGIGALAGLSVLTGYYIILYACRHKMKKKLVFSLSKMHDEDTDLSM
jgi:sigma-E factor negative regulatory protein RseC